MSDDLKDRDDWSSASESLFRTARRAHDPTADDRARVDAALTGTLGGEFIASQGSSASDAVGSPQPLRALGLSKIAKLSLGLLCIAVGSFAVWRSTSWFGASQPQPVPAANTAPTSATTPQATQAPPARVAAARPLSDSDAEPTRPAPDQTESTERTVKSRARGAVAKTRKPSAEVAVVETPSSVRSADSSASDRSASATSTERTPGDPTRSTPAAQPSAASVASAATRVRKSAEPSEESTAEDRTPRTVGENTNLVPDDARAELAVVARMHAALGRTDYPTALTLAAEHERRWPHGMFEVEREGVRAIAACGARASDAAARAARFLANNPHAPVAMRVRSACSAQLSARQAR